MHHGPANGADPPDQGHDGREPKKSRQHGQPIRARRTAQGQCAGRDTIVPKDNLVPGRWVSTVPP
jgi:hypothetical protein